MTNFIGRLGVTLGLDSAEFSRGIEGASKKLEQLAASAKRYGALAGTALVAASTAAIAYADELVDVANANDVAISSIIQLRDALAKSGGEAGNASKFLSSFTQYIDKAAEGSFEAQKTLKGLGISLQDLKTLSIDELFRKAAIGLSQMDDALTRNAKGMEVFGKSFKGVDAKGFAEEISKATTVSKEHEEGIKAAAEAYDMLAEKSRRAMESLAATVGPAIKAAIENFDKLIAAMKVSGEEIDKVAKKYELSFSRGGFTRPGQQKESVLPGLSSEQQDAMFADRATNQARTAARVVKPGIDKDAEAERKRLLDNWAKGYLATQNEIEEAQKAISEQATDFQKKDLDFLEKRKTERQNALKQEQDEIDEGNRLIAEQTSEYQKANAALVQRQSIEAESINRQKIMLDLTDKGLLMKASEYQFAQEVLASQFRYLDAVKEIKANESLSFADKEAALLRLKALTESEFELAKQRLALAEKMQNATFGEGFFVAMIQSAQNATTAFQYGQQAFESMMGNMSSALNQFVQTGKVSFKDLAKSIIKDLIAIQLRAQATALFSRMIGAAFGGGPAVGPGMAAEALPAGFNQYLAKAEGGPVSSNTPYLVGERGPELFVPNRTGAIVPSHQLAGMMGGGQTINYNGPFIQQMSAIDTQSGIQFLAQNKQAVWAANQSAQRSLPMSR